MKTVQWKNTEKRRDDFDELILCLEKIFLLKFPEDYKQCAMENGGGTPEPCRFDTDKEKGIKVERLLSLDPRSEFFSYYMSSINNKTFLYPIALDSKGHYIFLDYKEGFPPKVSYRDPDAGYLKQSNGLYRMSVACLCDSFTEFLEMLY